MSAILGRVTEGLGSLRTAPARHWAVQLLALFGGIALAHVHWLGLIVGGAAVGIVAATFLRAILAGLGFGIVVLAVWAVELWLAGSFAPAMAMGQISILGVTIALVLPLLGSLVRGVV